MPKGSWREAAVAGPLSPAVVGLPLPAMVVISAAREGAAMEMRARRMAEGRRRDMGRMVLGLDQYHGRVRTSMPRSVLTRSSKRRRSARELS